MLDTIVAATAEDLKAVCQLYDDVCAHQALDEYSARWTPGVYPTHDDLAAHVNAGELYVGLLEGRLAGAMVLTAHEDPEYAGVPWPTPAEPDEVAVVHLLCVHPQARGHQAGLALTREALRLARHAGKKVVHLDVVPGNHAASRIYLAAGFSHACDHQIYYEDTGTMTFEMYECVL